MAHEVVVPTTGNAGEDAVVLSIAVAVGETVQVGQVLATLETAKASVDVEALQSGTVLTIHAAEGDEVREHSILMTVGAAGESSDDSQTPGKLNDAPAENTAERVSPRARAYADRQGVSLETVQGTGPLGRIIAPDVRAADTKSSEPIDPFIPNSESRSSEPELTPAGEADREDTFQTIPVVGARKVTAERMSESLRTSAQLTLTRYADATLMLSFLQRLRQKEATSNDDKITLNDAILFVCAKTLSQHPAANSHFDFSGIKQFKNVHIGFAVDTGSALLVPVIPFANLQSLRTLSQNTKGLVSKAKAGKLTVEEMSGGTFTVTNLGSLGVHWFTPVLNPPQSCILGVGATHQHQDGAPKLLPLSLTFDHRAIDGAAAAALLADIAKSIEDFDLLVAE